jgi:hypothetical protein
MICCIGCGKKIERYDDTLPEATDPATDMWDGGIVEWITAGYGSRLDTNRYLIGICDDCMEGYDHV